jgi:hypothetical protein
MELTSKPSSRAAGLAKAAGRHRNRYLRQKRMFSTARKSATSFLIICLPDRFNVKNFSKYVLFPLLASLIAHSAQSATVICTGTVASLSYHQPGRLYLRLSSMNYEVAICSTDSEWVVPGSLAGNTSVSACKTIYGSLVAAKISGATVSNLYLDGDQVPAACNGFAPWTNVNLRYVNLL